jgi:class 3 adenylate cyclase
MILATDVREALHVVQAPTLIVHDVGNETWKFEEHARYAEERIPGARRVELPGSHVYVYASDVADPFLDRVEVFLTGVRRGPDPDRVLATVLFTDIVGSTAHVASMGDRAWRTLLEDHDAMVRRQLDRFAGREIDTTGDGFLASFHGPAQAIRCALSIRNGAGQLGIAVRAGVHTGEVELRGEDIGGIAVHIGARVSALAGDGEVLVSSTVKDLVVGSGIEFDERGSHELKGVPGEWRLYAVKE